MNILLNRIRLVEFWPKKSTTIGSNKKKNNKQIWKGEKNFYFVTVFIGVCTIVFWCILNLYYAISLRRNRFIRIYFDFSHLILDVIIVLLWSPVNVYMYNPV